ncbi:MAG TPA: hypothetical protein VMT23_01665 [Candidatus Binatia bacterium]|nr:hypothetical protein [Candidatus Binatia bacterium]
MSELNWSLGHLDHLVSPWANAGGVVKSVEEVALMAQTGVGWVEAGSYTLEPRYGNQYDKDGKLIISQHTGQPVRVYYHDALTGETFNSLGMPNKGMDVVEQEIAEMAAICHARGKYLLINVAPVSDDPVTESIELVRRAYEAGADGVILNGGCPNVLEEDGGRHQILSRNARATGQVLRGLRPITEQFQPVFFRTSPQDSREDEVALLKEVVESGTVSVLLRPNTWPGQRPVDAEGKDIIEVPGGLAGKSGPAVAAEAFRASMYARRMLSGSGIDVVLSSGVMDSEALNLRAVDTLHSALNAGMLACGTTFYYENPSQRDDAWRYNTDKLLRDLDQRLAA